MAHCTAFQNNRRIASGDFAEVLPVAQAIGGRRPEANVLLFDDETGELIDPRSGKAPAAELRPGYQQPRRSKEAAYRFLAAIASSEPGFEAAVSALFAGDQTAFERASQAWPVDVSDHARKLAAPAFRGDKPALRLGGLESVRRLEIRASFQRPILPFNLQDAAASEGYRRIRTRLLLSKANPQVIVVTSPNPGDGKTLTSANLACAFALQPDLNVLLIDADLRMGGIAATFGMPRGPGLGDYLDGRCTVEDALIRAGQFPNLCLMTSGEHRSNPVELLDSARWRNLIAGLRQSFQFIFIDVPPMEILADYELAEQAGDGALLVVRENHTDRRAMRNALAAIPKGKMLGVVMNDAADFFAGKRAVYGYREAETVQP